VKLEKLQVPYVAFAQTHSIAALTFGQSCFCQIVFGGIIKANFDLVRWSDICCPRFYPNQMESFQLCLFEASKQH
jgi:NADH:ubiquinone oxidoreductase subunit B-like Fe-S oxidoreductase